MLDTNQQGTPAPVSSFTELGLQPALLQTLQELGYEEPTPIQSVAIKPLLTGQDVLGLAATGTGKTAAFALPMLQRIKESLQAPDSAPSRSKTRVVKGLVLVPTRELAMQVAEAFNKYGRLLSLKTLAIYGGQAISLQLRELKAGVDIIIATPGRALDHLERQSLKLEQVQSVVLDEADEMLKMGFAEDLEAILKNLPAQHQTALFSATFPETISHLAKKYLHHALRLNVSKLSSSALKAEQAGLAVEQVKKVRQTAYIVPRAHKIAALTRILDLENPELALIFCRMRSEVDELSEILNRRNYTCTSLHGGMSQEQRDRTLKNFRSKTCRLLIATDVAARGLDIRELSHVFNYDVPAAPESYVHRIGRTGRAGQAGVAITIAEPSEQRQLRNIERWAKSKIESKPLPTLKDIQAQRLSKLQLTLQELIQTNDLQTEKNLLNTLTKDLSLQDIAAAMLKKLLEPAGDLQEIDIPPLKDYRDREPSFDGPRNRERSYQARAPRRPDKNEHYNRRPEEKSSLDNRRFKAPYGSRTAAKTGKLYIDLGKNAGIRPQDLVGAIANESGLAAKDIGQITIQERFSLVEVPEKQLQNLIDILKHTKIKGRKIHIKRDRQENFR